MDGRQCNGIPKVSNARCVELRRDFVNVATRVRKLKVASPTLVPHLYR